MDCISTRQRTEDVLRPLVRFMGVLYPLVGIFSVSLIAMGCGDPRIASEQK